MTLRARRVLAWIGGALLLLLIGATAWLYTPDRDQAALRAAYAGPPSRFMEVAGVTLHIRDTGPRDGPPILMLHGFGASLHSWDGWAALLSERFRVIRIDMPGFALTGADPTDDYSDARSVAVLAALLDMLGVAQADVIGNSMGGRIAWRFALAQPARVRRLVLVSPDGFASPGRPYGPPEAVPAMLRLLPWVLPRAMVRGTLAPAYGDPTRMSEAEVDRAHDLLRAPGVRRAILDRMAQTALEDPRPSLPHLAMPVLLVWGELDRMIPASHAQDWVAVMPRAELVLLPGLGHVPQEEAPEASLPAVRAFLER
ncbi:alpha/beta fold hydrolase [Roseomonas sp. CAU 1739]|uniref:alpha/beta fold hydrolase n=1 Tax=Roseomonas sp. CAU 1739 TaxID=3140364 RepID=UPI00325AEE2A